MDCVIPHVAWDNSLATMPQDSMSATHSQKYGLTDKDML